MTQQRHFCVRRERIRSAQFGANAFVIGCIHRNLIEVCGFVEVCLIRRDGITADDKGWANAAF
jgi:hypothetical protein